MRETDADHTGDGDGLEIAEEKDGGTGNVGSSMGMTETAGDGTAQQSTTGDDGSDPTDDGLVYRLAVVEESLNTTHWCAIGVVDPNLCDAVDIRNLVCDTWNMRGD